MSRPASYSLVFLSGFFFFAPLWALSLRSRGTRERILILFWPVCSQENSRFFVKTANWFFQGLFASFSCPSCADLWLLSLLSMFWGFLFLHSDWSVGFCREARVESRESRVNITNIFLAYTTPTIRDICTFAVLCSVSRSFCCFTRVYGGHSMLCYKEEF